MRWTLQEGLVEPQPFCELIWAAAVGALGSIAGAVIGGSASQSAANTQASAAKNAANVQLQMFNQIQGNLAPFLKFGQGAIPQYEAALPGLEAPFSGANLPQTPGYQFALQQGEQAAQNSFAGQGLSKSGPAIKGAVNYAEGLAGTTYGQVFQNQLAQKGLQANIFQNVIGAGQNAGASLGGFGVQTGANVGANIVGAGAAQAAGTIGVASAANAGIGGVSNNALLAALLANQNPAQGGGGTYDPTAGVTGITGLPYYPGAAQ